VVESTSGPPVTNELSIEDAIGTRMTSWQSSLFKAKCHALNTHLSTT
jgi:hypothetical protein